MREKQFKILTIDGGGSKGVYSLGILYEIEAKLGSPLLEHFDLFYGCSTGAIIAAALAKGKKVLQIKDMYFKGIPKIMNAYRSSSRSRLLKEMLEKEFGNDKFDVFKKFVHIIATSEDQKKPRIFKSHKEGAHGRKDSFEPGFNKSILEALISSCSATPFFTKSTLGHGCTLIDGSFCSNNPTLFAAIDALKAFKKKTEEILLLSIGTGEFLEKITFQFIVSVIKHALSKSLLITLQKSHANTMQLITEMLLDDINILRIDDKFTDLKTSFLEKDSATLEKLFSRGRSSFGKIEKEFDKLFLA